MHVVCGVHVVIHVQCIRVPCKGVYLGRGRQEARLSQDLMVGSVVFDGNSDSLVFRNNFMMNYVTKNVQGAGWFARMGGSLPWNMIFAFCPVFPAE